jgi:YD repeat-containing protein
VKGSKTGWTYNNDNTIHTLTDARGVTATYSYNSRRLLTGINYPSSLPTGVTATADVSFTYGAAGNRLSMSDGSGSTSYVFDSLSRITSETKTFAGLSGSFTLAYEYNRANQVKSVTDQHSSVSFTTVYDYAGRVSSVSGVGYGSTPTQFASQVSYRAWGGLKSSVYGNSTSLTLGYNARGLITSYSAAGSVASFQYYADGQIKFAQDQSTYSEPIKDRAFSYDHAERLAEAYSGSEARNFINNTSNAADGPFRQSYRYDVWSNMVNQNWRFWSRNGQTTASYNSSNRNTVWSYDADGNLLSRGDGAQYGYDAAGDGISQNQETSYYDSENNGTVGLFFRNGSGRGPRCDPGLSHHGD